MMPCKIARSRLTQDSDTDVKSSRRKLNNEWADDIIDPLPLHLPTHQGTVNHAITTDENKLLTMFRQLNAVNAVHGGDGEAPDVDITDLLNHVTSLTGSFILSHHILQIVAQKAYACPANQSITSLRAALIEQVRLDPHCNSAAGVHLLLQHAEIPEFHSHIISIIKAGDACVGQGALLPVLFAIKALPPSSAHLPTLINILTEILIGHCGEAQGWKLPPQTAQHISFILDILLADEGGGTKLCLTTLLNELIKVLTIDQIVNSKLIERIVTANCHRRTEQHTFVRYNLLCQVYLKVTAVCGNVDLFLDSLSKIIDFFLLSNQFDTTSEAFKQLFRFCMRLCTHLDGALRIARVVDFVLAKMESPHLRQILLKIYHKALFPLLEPDHTLFKHLHTMSVVHGIPETQPNFGALFQIIVQVMNNKDRVRSLTQQQCIDQTNMQLVITQEYVARHGTGVCAIFGGGLFGLMMNSTCELLEILRSKFAPNLVFTIIDLVVKALELTRLDQHAANIMHLVSVLESLVNTVPKGSTVKMFDPFTKLVALAQDQSVLALSIIEFLIEFIPGNVDAHFVSHNGLLNNFCELAGEFEDFDYAPLLQVLFDVIADEPPEVKASQSLVLFNLLMLHELLGLELIHLMACAARWVINDDIKQLLLRRIRYFENVQETIGQGSNPDVDLEIEHLRGLLAVMKQLLNPLTAGQTSSASIFLLFSSI